LQNDYIHDINCSSTRHVCQISAHVIYFIMIAVHAFHGWDSLISLKMILLR